MSFTASNRPAQKRRLITSALPYVNNIPHLGNLIQVLSADVFARFCRSRGYETLYICGTDEYGTATETRAREEGVSPKELCDRYFSQHRDIYRWFDISFDKFGRTTDPAQTRIVQEIFLQIYEAGFITSHEQKQLYSEVSQMFLADRYVRGTCPKCGYKDARGDQCENCGTLLDPLELIDPISVPDGSVPVVRETTHLYLNLPKLLPALQQWMSRAKEEGFWNKNSVRMTEAWMRDGLRERAITRDLRWGIPVPLENFSNKVFYVWFDAPIGYVSITAEHTDEWETRWWKNPDEVQLFQFIGKDNIPFHTVLFPATQLAWEMGRAAAHPNDTTRWTKAHHISSTEYLNYEGGMFSKSRGIGVFGNDAMETGIPADMWRFYMMFNRPETSDYMFTWEDFQESVNGQLINNLANLCNRSFSFIYKNMDGTVDAVDTIADGEIDEIRREIIERENAITALLEKAELRKAYREIFILSNYGNKLFQDSEPWKLKTEDAPRMRRLLSLLAYLIRDLAVLTEPFTPAMARAMVRHFGIDRVPAWNSLMAFCGAEKNAAAPITTVEKPELLFSRLEDGAMAGLKERFSGSQEERIKREGAAEAQSNAVPQSAAKSAPASAQNKNSAAQHTSRNTSKDMQKNETKPAPDAPKDAGVFARRVRLVAATVQSVQPHPDADKLYVLTLDDGSGEPRSIVSGLRQHYAEDALVGKTIVIVANLKKAKFRGVESNGMLLAASREAGGAEELAEELEVLFLDGVPAGSQVFVEGLEDEANTTDNSGETPSIKADEFFAYDLRVIDHVACAHEKPLLILGKPIRTGRIANGRIG